MTENLSARHCERSEAIQSLFGEAVWIASSQELLAMTETPSSSRHPEVAASSAALEGRRPGSFILRGSTSGAFAPLVSHLRMTRTNTANTN
ncbi:hypothetical protein ACVIW2_007867 [Bradyrhizobium huanghuaihaiense]|uniref:Uncharacterized protein n=1 Tax=Bradyrhizobium huanghuaihaiense TaxID=990078 RepID=A0A562RSK3_9BRAD|nr:hypothetical protein IQ16_02966 [Bradyrhizobium huanghuaihaiense]